MMTNAHAIATMGTMTVILLFWEGPSLRGGEFPLTMPALEDAELCEAELLTLLLELMIEVEEAEDTEVIERLDTDDMLVALAEGRVTEAETDALL